jgi:hypothetical protein
MWRGLPLLRAIGVLSAVGILMTVATFAALQSTGNALTGNSIETATANLQISNDGTTYVSSVPGFDFDGVIPGPMPQGNHAVTLKNVGTTNVGLLLGVPAQPTINGITDLSHVSIVITQSGTGGVTYTPQIIKLSDLLAGNVPLGKIILFKGSSMSFSLQVMIDSGSVPAGAAASISGLDIVFTGLPQ